MTTNLDIDVLPIYRLGGFNQPDIPGLHLAIPPSRTARGRASDLLLLFLDLRGNAPLSPNQQGQLLSTVSRSYYRHRGSVTASIRSAADGLNHYLLDRNLRSASNGLQSIGMLTVIAARGNRIYIGQSGPTHIFLIKPNEAEHIYDTNLAGRGLGTSRTTPMRFIHMDMTQGGLILLSPSPPQTWSATTLKGSHELRLEKLHRQLLNQAGPDLTAVLFKVQPGQGQLHLLQPVTGAPSSQAPVERTKTDSGAGGTESEPPAQAAQSRAAYPDPPLDSAPSIPNEWGTPTTEEVPPDQDLLASPLNYASAEGVLLHEAQVTPAVLDPQPHDQAVITTETIALDQPEVSSPPVSPARSVQEAAVQKPRKRSSIVGKRFVALLTSVLIALGRIVVRIWRNFTNSLRMLLARMLPGEGLLTLPSSVMAFIAISVPLVVVAIALVVYTQRGLTAQHQAYLDRALFAANQAAQIEDPNEARLAWKEVLKTLETAESYNITDESAAVHNQAQSALDQLDGVTRVSFQRALTSPLPDVVTVSRLVASKDDLYMLNSDDGTIKRAWLTGRGYEQDVTFRCGPGIYGSFIVGPLVDLAILPKGNEFDATVLAMDKNGNLIYCIPSKPPISAPLAPPDSNWGEPMALKFDAGSLYILDPQTNAVWIYRGDNSLFQERPDFFFADQVPSLQDVIDLAIDRQDLYLIHTDGHITLCMYSNFQEAPTRCTDPALFTDTRPGRQEGPQIAEALFSQILFTPPPDPSIYLLDPFTQAIYHFSVRLTLQNQFRSGTTLPEEHATAFTISPNRTAFIAVGNEVFYATLP